MYKENKKGIITFFTDRHGGVSKNSYDSFNLGLFCGDDSENVMENRRRLCVDLEIPTDRLFIPKEVHGNRVEIIDSAVLSDVNSDRRLNWECDAFVTAEHSVCLGVTTADCVPVLMYDPNIGVVSAVHAGWKGIVAEIVPATIKKMTELFGANPLNIQVMIGPSISTKCFEVGDEVIDCFSAVFSSLSMDRIVLRESFRKPHIDLKKAVKIQVESFNILEQHIFVHPDCTFSNSNYFSARRDGFASGRNLSGILIG